VASQACDDCRRKPEGLVGHEGLVLATVKVKGVGHVFRCARCKMLWTRSYEGAGHFAWIELPPVEGAEAAEGGEDD
jgi:hypothetical protein